MDSKDGKTIFYPYDEMNTFLIPVTTGCSYNKCAFCSMYKDENYKEVSLKEIEKQLMHGDTYTERIFLTGADPMTIGFDKMKHILDLVKKHLPHCACVASYAAIKSIAKYSLEELSILHDAGLRLLYIGFETGRDDILKLMKKGHTVENAITQAQRLNQVNLQFNSIVMYGIAGEGESVENAIATAKMLNKFQSNKIITMNLMVFEGTELQDMVRRGEFIPSSGSERLLEVRTLLENLKPKKETIFDTTHPTNLVHLKGKLPEEKQRLLVELNK